jgi:hypothetical protein
MCKYSSSFTLLPLAPRMAPNETEIGASVCCAPSSLVPNRLFFRSRKLLWNRWARPLAPFCHITDNFAAGLFHCYDVEGLPRTNNDLEHGFGVARVHERRAIGRRGAIPGVVVRGSVRVIAAVVTREQSFSGEELRPCDYQRWHELRVHVQQCEETRRQQFRFRKNPAAYLAALEAQLLT